MSTQTMTLQERAARALAQNRAAWAANRREQAARAGNLKLLARLEEQLHLMGALQ